VGKSRNGNRNQPKQQQSQKQNATTKADGGFFPFGKLRVRMTT
jgi:hypothetical protein